MKPARLAVRGDEYALARQRRRLPNVFRIAGGLVGTTACAREPGMLSPASGPASLVAWLGWSLIIAAVVVSILIAALLVLGIARARRRLDEPVVSERDGTPAARWIPVGASVTAAVLIGSFAATTYVLVHVMHPPRTPTIRVTVTGHRWWWDVRYDEPAFTTANEIHVPVGVPVRLVLRSADVIHSFWVPALTGKTDLVPGHPAETWLRADRPGRYGGRCAEYCGLQHAHMALEVVAESADDYAAWQARQQTAARAPNADLVDGQRLFVEKCGACHSVSGTAAAGTVGPDLTHVASRRELAAGILPNTAGHLAGWIADPQGAKPGSLMPRVPLASQELIRIVEYVETLR